ncbi:Uncharacterized protein TSPI_08702 [Trichinella spiralis]|uniref:Uncharacterized protein n=1 Tax=Trichinella spiralis TaxID=6334 RepID=A0ABR3KCL5_TRISP
MNSQRNSYEEVFKRNERLLEVLQSQESEEVKKAILQRHIRNTFMLPMFANVPTPPPPTGEITEKRFIVFIPTNGCPFDVYLRIIGPRGPEMVRIHIYTMDYENVADWRIGEAKKRITELIKIPLDGQDTIKKLQLAELAYTTICWQYITGKAEPQPSSNPQHASSLIPNLRKYALLISSVNSVIKEHKIVR